MGKMEVPSFSAFSICLFLRCSIRRCATRPMAVAQNIAMAMENELW